MTGTNKPPRPHMDEVQAAFFADIQKHGLEHTFHWMQGWFDRVAAAAVEDELLRAFGPEGMDDEQAVALHAAAADMMMPLATGISNHSTLATANLLRESMLAAWAKRLNRSAGYGGQRERLKQWEAWQAQREAAAS